MKRLKTMIAAGIVLLALVSCATGPEGPADAADNGKTGESAAAPAETEKAIAEPVAVWKQAWETVMAPDGTVDKQIEYLYDGQGKVEKIVERDGRDELLYLRTFFYDNGVPVSLEMSDRYGLVSETLYETDNDGRVVAETKKNARGENLSVVTREFSDGRMVRSVAADGEGTPHLSAEYEYKGDIVSRITYRLPSGKEEASFLRTIKGGRVVEEKTVLPDGTVETARTFEYEGDRITTEVHFAADRETKSVRYDYDGDGNVIRETWSTRTGRDYEILERRWILVEETE